MSESRELVFLAIICGDYSKQPGYRHLWGSYGSAASNKGKTVVVKRIHTTNSNQVPVTRYICSVGPRQLFSLDEAGTIQSLMAVRRYKKVVLASPKQITSLEDDISYYEFQMTR